MSEFSLNPQNPMRDALLRADMNGLGLVVADHVGAMLAYWDRDLICRFANNAFGEWFGKSRDQLVGNMSMKTLLGTALYEESLPYIEGVMDGDAQTFEREMLLPSGELRPSLVSYYPDILDGQVRGFFVQVTDITLVKKLERQLKTSEMKFKGLLESAPDAVVIVDEEGIIQLVNNQFEAVFGYAKGDVLGHFSEILIPEELRATYVARKAEFMTTSRKRAVRAGFVLQGLHKSGREFPIEITLSTFKTAKGMLVSAAIRDISWKVEKEKDLLHSVETISEQNTRLLNFSHIVSHNLRTHAGNLHAVLGLLQGTDSETEKSHLFSLLQNISTGFTETIDNLNKIVEVQTNADLRKENVNLHAFIGKSLKVLSLNIAATHATIHNKVDPTMEIVSFVAYIESILLNLLSNALKYRSPDRDLVIDIQAYSKDNDLVLEIRDNGRGIDMEKYGLALFGMYKTFHGNKDAKGVGLFITKSQVESLGGHIDVDSKVGVGTTFRIFLPFQQHD